MARNVKQTARRCGKFNATCNGAKGIEFYGNDAVHQHAQHEKIWGFEKNTPTGAGAFPGKQESAPAGDRGEGRREQPKKETL